jgi:hypothetical protein
MDKKTKKVKRNIICWLFGHKISETTDRVYCICDRCGMHEYYDYDRFYNGIPFRRAWWWIKYLPIRIHYWYRSFFFKDLPF